MFTEAELSLLARRINDRIRRNFEKVHLSGNLMNTIIIRRTTLGFEIEIPAEMYDIQKYIKEGFIEYTGEGSYAEAVNKSGGFSKQHIDYVENAIAEGINEWLKELNIKPERINWI